ncbi:MAG: CD225/dispanin family protein [Verrucomicrobiales bacterium]|nr:CD225/dispanin family protein [Verrucomicrobiales bacterium]
MDWYYATNGQQNGPVSQEELVSLFEKGDVRASDLVWNEAMPDWVAYRSVPELNVSPEPVVESQEESTAPPPMVEEAPVTSSTLSPVTRPSAGSTEKVPSYLWQSIVCLVLCCLPAAIPALIFAVKVGPALEKGEIDEAKEASRLARMWCWIAFGLGLIANIAFFAIGVVGAIAEQT